MRFEIVKRIVFLLVLIPGAFHVKAQQAPGYLGKHVTMGYGFYFNPAFNSALYNYSNSSVNILHEFFLECATGTRYSVGASVRLYNYTYNNAQMVDIPDSRYYVLTYKAKPEGSYDISGQNVQIYAKRFKSGYLAPWGKYLSFGLVVSHYKTTYNPNNMRVLVRDGNTYIPDFGPPTQSRTGADLLLGGGNSRIFSNRFVVDYGYTVNFLAAARVLYNVFDFFRDTSPPDYIRRTAAKRVAAINRLNFYFKLGYLF